ncbi:DNA internalization-related competence protein ComEC/Rec2 [Trinickia diaoshuihuensis]|uniref:DNA internalization-related competence protein ComEC/Rec2 n=1 Tax=Trinickia diaoshuihuensis TaxID=2292265 RepID=UPI000E22FF80|nr:DNA internalization-related competence protein ComEC/Rec2 [Trinickia diaoshuihuensis]
MRAMLIGFALGITLLQQCATLPGRWQWALLGVVLTTACGAACRARGWHARTALALAALVAGFGYAGLRAQSRMAELLPSAWELRELTVTGHVRGLPTQGAASARFFFALDRDDLDAVRHATGVERFPSILQLNWARGRGGEPPRLKPGDRWRLTVRLKRPHGPANFLGYDAEAAWLARGVRATGNVVAAAAAQRLSGAGGGIGTAIDRARFALRERVARALASAEHRGIVTALAIGTQDTIADADRVVLRRTGTSHLVAVSGLHIGFVAAVCGALAAWIWRRSCGLGRILARRGAREWPLLVPTPVVAALAAVASAAGYAALAGFNVPAQRALWMLVVVSAAFLWGRGVSSSLVLAWAAVLVLIVDPWAVTAAGFWLSFGAVACIALTLRSRLRVRGEDEEPDDAIAVVRATDPAWRAPLEPSQHARRQRWRRLLATLRRRCFDAVRAQWAVTVGLAPLTAFWFSQVSLIGPLANAVAVPWVSVLVVPIVLVAVVLPAPLDALAYQFAHTLLAPLMRVLSALSQWPWADGHPPQPSLWALASALAGSALSLMPRGWPLRWAAPLAWLPLALPPPSGIAQGAFRLTALDVGQGAAIVVETRRRTLLFDAGPGAESTHAGERIVVPYLRAAGIAGLDMLVVSHGDADHAGGVPAVLASAGAAQVIAGLPSEHRVWDAARGALAERLRCAAGQRWRWDGVDFEVLWPEPGPLPRRSNEQSCVLKVSGADMSALLTGDIGAPSERALLRRAPEALRADVLLVAHHGSRTSSTEPFLDSVDPRVAVFQVGYRNRFRHPHPHVWSRFQARGIELARTDRDGAVRIATKDGRLTIERYRASHARYWMDG